MLYRFNIGSGGFSLLELMVAITVLGVLAALAVPSFQTFGRNSRVAAAQSDLVTALSFARSEAVRRGANVTICATEDFTSCDDESEWSTGWIAFVDNAGVAGQLNPGDERLQMWAGPGADQVDWEFGMFLTADPSFVRFSPTGTVTPAVQKWFTIRPETCAAATRQARRVIAINAIGHVRSTRMDCP